MKRIALLILGLMAINYTFSQVTDEEKRLRAIQLDSVSGWKTGGVIGLNVAQASFTNWASGGQNSISVNGLVSLFANHRTINSAWDNMLDLGYGIMQQGENGAVLKTDDKIDFSSKYGQAATKNLFYAALLNFKTQTDKGYNYPNDSVKISDFLAPAYLVGAIGMDYKPSDNFTGFLAPITMKTTFISSTKLADAGAFGVDPATYDAQGNLLSLGKKVKTEFGGYMRVVYKHTFFKDQSVSLLSKLDLFSNYLKNPQNVDVNWENIISLKVNKYLATTITTQLIYDDDIKVEIDKNTKGSRIQFKEVISVGFSYKF